MTDKAETPFIDYWDAVDACLERAGASLSCQEDAAIIAGAQEEGTSPIACAESLIRLQRIRKLNDLSRTAMGIAGRVYQTAGISALSEADQSAIRERVERFNGFTEDNDPYGEHDFGAFEFKGQKIFWKIDYYDRTLEQGSPDPADPKATCRVLMIMLADEW